MTRRSRSLLTVALASAGWSLLASVAACIHNFDEVTLPGSAPEDGAQDGAPPDVSTGSDASMSDTLGSDHPADRAGEASPADGAPDVSPQLDAAPKPQCDVDARTAPRTIFTEGFEGYSGTSLYNAPGSPWIQVTSGRESSLTTLHPHTGATSFELASFTTRSEVTDVLLPIGSAPRRVVVELWYTPDGGGFSDFAEFGLANTPAKFDLFPVAGVRVHEHVLTLRTDAAPPFTDGGTAAGVELYREFEYGISTTGPLVTSYVRADFDFCSNLVSVYVTSGADGGPADAPLRGTTSFQGDRPVNALYLAGGVNRTYIDDIVVSAEGGD